MALVDAMAATLELHDLGVVEKAVEQDAGGDVVAEHGAEVFDGPVAGQDGGAGFVTAAEDLEQVFGRSRRQRTQAEVLEDEQVDATQARDHFLTSAGGGGLGKILGEVESGAVEHGVAGLHGADTDADADVRLAESGRTEDERAAALADEAQGGDGVWYSLGTLATSDGTNHTYQISRKWTYYPPPKNSEYDDYWTLDGHLEVHLYSPQLGVYDEAGLESYSSPSLVIYYANSSLQYQKYEGSFVNWSGRDLQTVGSSMCGKWLSDTSWESAENQVC